MANSAKGIHLPPPCWSSWGLEWSPLPWANDCKYWGYQRYPDSCKASVSTQLRWECTTRCFEKNLVGDQESFGELFEELTGEYRDQS
jgi:hypothetical protein